MGTEMGMENGRNNGCEQKVMRDKSMDRGARRRMEIDDVTRRSVGHAEGNETKKVKKIQERQHATKHCENTRTRYLRKNK